MKRVILTIFFCILTGCSGSDSQRETDTGETRTWEMGFYFNAPRYGDVALAVEGIDLFSARSEAVMLHGELPWELMLDGTTELDEILDEKGPLIDYLKSKGLKIFFMADLTDDLSRGEEAPTLRELERSITETEVQQRYRDYVLAFAYTQPEDIPDNYYQRLLNGRTVPVMVCEGGWTSQGVASVISSPELQARYISRHAALLDSVHASAVINTLFADIELDSLPTPYPETLPLFINLGLMYLDNDDYAAKPALSEWDRLFERSLE